MFRRNFLKLLGIATILPSVVFNRKKVIEFNITTSFDINQCLVREPDVNIELKYEDGTVEKYLSRNQQWIINGKQKHVNSIIATNGSKIRSIQYWQSWESYVIGNTIYLHTDLATCIIRDVKRIG